MLEPLVAGDAVRLPPPTRTGHLLDPPTPRRPDRFYGWHIVAYSAVALAATAPGQTAAVSAFIDPMMRDLGVSRGQISTAYLLGTLTGAAAMPFVGRAIDRYGTRRSMLVDRRAFGAVLLSLALVQGLARPHAGVRRDPSPRAGRARSAATTAAARWFIRRRGTALGIVSAAGAAGISTAPLCPGAPDRAHGWRVAWVVEGVFDLARSSSLWPSSRMKRRPAHLGQRPDGAAGEGHDADREARGATRRRRWYAVLLGPDRRRRRVGLLSTAVAFHQISLLGERGLSTAEAAANFMPQTVAGLVATLATGHLVDRIGSRWLTAVSMVAPAPWAGQWSSTRLVCIGSALHSAPPGPRSERWSRPRCRGTSAPGISAPSAAS